MFFNPDNPKTYNLNVSHPIIPNPQEILYYKKYVSIHSDDRDILKYPSSSEFEIELPEDIINVQSLRLSTWTFPANYNTFSDTNNNITMTFQINFACEPIITDASYILYNAIYQALAYDESKDYTIVIEQGFYNPIQFAVELTNKFNEVVTLHIINYFNNNGYGSLVSEFNDLGGYTRFVIVYNSVNQKIWFGNNADGFILKNSSNIGTTTNNYQCLNRNKLPEYSNWGLPYNVGLPRSDTTSISITGFSPRFYYGDVTNGDNGYWLVANSNLTNAQCHYYECPYKINLMGPSHFYMEIEGQNCIDETSPYSLSPITLNTNETNGIVNSSFAKIAMPTTPIAQWFDRDSYPYKFYTPPAERIRRLKFKLRYHNGQLVNFDTFDYTFSIEFVMLQPQKIRAVTAFGRQLESASRR